ncbi:uncharacterized protein M6B38_257835 [Iris pallida]|uniref:DUF3741 domain-containing protein n=1 Tax=Iris pallida TaxID=29817 RepID=A0AAX6IF63_IRIPA|nr:uncharacterized protein M6B38_257835 [Iris pallida]
MDYRKECESRLLEVSVGAHKLTQMISSWSTKEPNLGNEQSKNVTRDLLKGSFDLEESAITLRKLQQATWMMSRARQNLELDLDRERGLAHSRRLESNCVEELKKVIRESSYRRNVGSVSSTNDDDERTSSSSQSLRFATSRGHHIAQPRRAKGPSLIAKLMGLEAIPSDIGHSAREEQEDKFLVQLEPPLGIEMLKARMRPLMEKKPEAKRNTLKDVVEEKKNGVNDCTNVTSSYGSSSYSSPSNSSHTYGEVPPIVMLQTPQLPNHEKFLSKKVVHEKVGDNAQILSGKSEKKEVAKPRDSKQIACARQQQQRRMSIGRKRESVKTEKAVPSPTSQAKLSSRAQAYKLDKSRAAARGGEQVVLAANAPRSHRRPDSWGSMEPVKAKKKKEVKPARKAVDIILAATGNAMYDDAKTINRSRSRTLPVAALPKHMENSKQCNRGHRRKDSKLFCEAMVKTSKGGSRKSRSPSSSSEAKQLPDDKTTIQSAASAEDIKLLLRSSQSFIARAQELCRLDDCQATHHRKTSAVEVGPEDAKLILGCARELVARKSLQLECSNHPIVRRRLPRSSAVVVCVDQLVEEIANEVEKLRARRRGEDGNGASSDRDDVDVMIEGDIGCKNVLPNAMWDQGWMDWICLEEAGHVVGPLERLILHGLVEELLLDLLH